MRRAIIGTAVLTGIVLGGCAQLSDAMSSIFSIFKVDFSLDDNAVDYGIEFPSAFKNSSLVSSVNAVMGTGSGISIPGTGITLPRAARSAQAKLDVLSLLGFSSVPDMLSKTTLKLTFNLKADNSKNKDKASFPFSSGLNLFVRDVTSDKRTTGGAIEPFDVAGGGITKLAIPVPVPLSLLTGGALNDVVDGKPIPYRVAGTFGFALRSPMGDTLGKDSTSMDLKTGNVATRPSTDASTYDFFVKVYDFLVN
ncbi:MAG: hypothetical protein RL318_2027 [Fibrobacterota bacterium]|jgi:hypothetical protein